MPKSSVAMMCIYKYLSVVQLKLMSNQHIQLRPLIDDWRRYYNYDGVPLCVFNARSVYVSGCLVCMQSCTCLQQCLVFDAWLASHACI